MVRIFLLDDDVEFLAGLQSHIESHLAVRGIEGRVIAFSRSESFWEHFHSDPPHIVFLDIMMPGDNGIRVARAVHAADKRALIVFLTSSMDFAMDGYGVNALLYLLKPLDPERISQAVDICRQRLSETRRIFVKTGNGLTGIDISTITHLESDNRHVYIYAPPAKHVHRGKLSDLAQTLPAEFAQVHKSFFVNLDHVAMVKYNMVVLDGGQAIPISRRFRKDATDRFFSRLESPL